MNMFDFVLTRPWKTMGKMLDPDRFERSLNSWVRKATIVNGRLAVKAMRKEIKSNIAPALHPLTLALKSPKTKSLVNTGQLWKSFGIQLLSDSEVFAGPVKAAWGKSMTESKGDFIDIAYVLHYGAKIPVTDKMRALWNKGFANRHGKVYPLKPETQHIVIKGRPWRNSIATAGFASIIEKNWYIAVSNAIYDEKTPFVSS